MTKYFLIFFAILIALKIGHHMGISERDDYWNANVTVFDINGNRIKEPRPFVQCVSERNEICMVEVRR